MIIQANVFEFLVNSIRSSFLIILINALYRILTSLCICFSINMILWSMKVSFGGLYIVLVDLINE